MTTWLEMTAAQKADQLKRYGVTQIGNVVDEPISLEEAQKHLKIDLDGSPPQSDDDWWLVNIGIPGARDWCEFFLGASIGQQTLEIATNGFPSGSIGLLFGPVVSVSSVVYLDADNVEQTMNTADYVLDGYVDPPQLRLAYGASWPTALNYENSVKVRYLTGYNLADDSPQTVPLPAGIRAAMLLVLGHLDINRETTVADTFAVTVKEIPLGAAALLERYRRRLSMA